MDLLGYNPEHAPGTTYLVGGFDEALAYWQIPAKDRQGDLVAELTAAGYHPERAESVAAAWLCVAYSYQRRYI